MNKFIANVCASLSLAVATVPAFAETAPTIKVSYADLNLANAADQHRLHNRLAGAAREVCEATFESGSLVQPAHSACMKKAIVRADADLAALMSVSKTQVAAR